MANTFLVGVDGSDCCHRAAEFAANAASAAGAELVLVYVIEWSPFTFNTPEENEQRHKRREEEIERANSEVLQPLIAKLGRPGLALRGAVRHGHAAEILAELAEADEVRQIFVGRLGSSRLKSLVFGSIAGSLAQISPVPVTIVP